MEQKTVTDMWYCWHVKLIFSLWSSVMSDAALMTTKTQVADHWGLLLSIFCVIMRLLS